MVCADQFRHRLEDCPIDGRTLPLSAMRELGVPQYQSEHCIRPRKREPHRARNPPAVSGNKTVFPSQPVELLQPPLDDHLAVEFLRPGFIADPRRVIRGYFRPLFEPGPDRRPFELGEFGYE